MAITVTPPTITPLSRTWTFKKIEENVRIQMNEVNMEKVTPLTIADYINIQLSDLCEMLSEASIPEYGSIATVTGITSETVIPLTALNIDRIIKITDPTNKMWLERKDKEFDNAPNFTQWAKNVMYWKFGENIAFYVGTSATALTGLTVSIYYYRQPSLLADDTAATKVDLPDKYVPLLIDKVCSMVYQQLGQQPPLAIQESISARTMQIRKQNLDEIAAIKSKGTIKGN
jgi:hypothetical protein